jgi:hypothetical protein
LMGDSLNAEREPFRYGLSSFELTAATSF